MRFTGTRRGINNLILDSYCSRLSLSTSTAQLSMLTSVPSDCLDAILAFLPLKSVVLLGSTSSEFLSDIQPDLRRRRLCFTQTFCYDSLSSETPVKAHTLASVRGGSSGANVVDIHLLPTVRDRIDSLWHMIPPSHPCSSQVKALKDAISTILPRENGVTGSSSIDEQQPADVESLLKEHRSNTQCHKLHASVLNEVINCEPVVSSSTDEEGNLSVTLERYIGDILCVFFLMGHSASGIVEASPAEATWMDDIVNDLHVAADELSDDPIAGGIKHTSPVKPTSWYRAWIFVHSSLLRVAPFTWNHQMRLGIASPISSSPASLDVAEGSLLRPHAPFTGCSKIAMMRTLSRMSDFSPIRARFNDFARLGVRSFRGRDSIESVTCYPVSVVGTAICFEQLPHEEYCRPGPASNFRPFLREWVQEQDSVIQFLLQLHVQSRRNRPMTVLPPRITLIGNHDAI
jgi:hypothetical protein